MRKVILSLGLLLLSGGLLTAQDKVKIKKKSKETVAHSDASPGSFSIGAPATPSLPAQPDAVNPDDMAFTDMVYDFGTIPEGPDGTCEFTFRNNGKSPIVIQKAQPSCGCTVPQFSSEPVLPGQTGKISVAYHTKGKPSAFTKTINVTSNAGNKVLTIKGNVEKAPTGSVPENVSMMKTN
ncbi:MAG: DUF1573 domain-containing protein [Bacteroidota bacterium]